MTFSLLTAWTLLKCRPSCCTKWQHWHSMLNVFFCVFLNVPVHTQTFNTSVLITTSSHFSFNFQHWNNPLLSPLQTLSSSVLPSSPLNTLQPCEPQVFYEATKLACPYSLKSESAELANYICIALLIEVSNSNLIISSHQSIEFHLSL